MMRKLDRKAILIKCAILAAYALFVIVMGHFGITCLFKHFLGIECPGCGITRACLSLLHGDVKAAVAYNPMVFSAPLLILYFFTDGRLFGRKIDRWVIAFILTGFLITWLIKII